MGQVVTPAPIFSCPLVCYNQGLVLLRTWSAEMWAYALLD